MIDNETLKLIQEMCNILTGNMHETLSKESYDRLASIAFYVGHHPDILNADRSET